MYKKGCSFVGQEVRQRGWRGTHIFWDAMITHECACMCLVEVLGTRAERRDAATAQAVLAAINTPTADPAFGAFWSRYTPKKFAYAA